MLVRIIRYVFKVSCLFFLWMPYSNAASASYIEVNSKAVNKYSSVVMLLDERSNFVFNLTNNTSESILVESLSLCLRSDELAFPESNIEIKIAKQWYVGSLNSIRVNQNGLHNPVLVDELLLKDDSLIKVDKNTRKNLLRVNLDKQESYIDISDPMVLMPNNAITRDQNSIQPFYVNSYESRNIWLTLKTNSIMSGRYNGYLLFKFKQKNKTFSKRVIFSINILPIKLSKGELTYGVYYLGQIRPISHLDYFFKNEKQYVAEINDIKSHGVLYPTMSIGWENQNGINKYFKMRAMSGFPCDKVLLMNGLGDSNNILKNTESWILALKYAIKNNYGCDNSKIFFYGIDEAESSKLAGEIAIWDSIHKYGASIYASSYKGDVYLLSNGKIDMLIYGNPSNLSIVNSFRNDGKDVLLYNSPQSGIANFDIYRKNYGYFLIKNNFSGAMPFAYQRDFPSFEYTKRDLSGGLCYSSKVGYCSAWNNFNDSGYYDHMFTYPTSDGVIDTVQWEGYAAAITDTRYYYTLVDLMKTKCSPHDDRCNFDPMTLIDVNDPGGTRQRIIDKIKLLISKN